MEMVVRTNKMSSEGTSFVGLITVTLWGFLVIKQSHKHTYPQVTIERYYGNSPVCVFVCILTLSRCEYISMCLRAYFPCRLGPDIHSVAGVGGQTRVDEPQVSCAVFKDEPWKRTGLEKVHSA